MLSLRSLIIIYQNFLGQIKAKSDNCDLETSVSLTETARTQLQRFQSSGWIVRFTDARDVRVRVLAWDLMTEVFDYGFLKTHPSVVQKALNDFLKPGDLFCVKISILKFLNRICDQLMHNVDITKEERTEFVGSREEEVSVKTLLQTITRQGLISQVHKMLAEKNTPLLFIALVMKLLHKLMQMDHKKALPVFT